MTHKGKASHTQKATAKKKEAFLKAYAGNGNITKSCEIAGICRKTYYLWVDSDQAFVEALKVADEMFNDKIEAEIDRRAIEGIKKGVYYKGELVHTELEYSDTLLIFRAKARMPEKYKERSETNIRSDVPFIFNMNIQAPDKKEDDGL